MPAAAQVLASTGVYDQVGRHVGHYATLDTAALLFTGTSNVQSSATAGQYDNGINPRQIGLTIRFDFLR